MNNTIKFTDKQNEKLDSYVNKIKNDYLNAGGTKESMMNDDTIWFALAGILHHDGEQKLDNFINNWKPSVTKRKSIGYAGI